MADQEEALYLNPPRIATAGRKLEEMAKMANIMESQGVNNDHMKQMWAGQSNILVAVRVRPLLKHDVVKKSCVRVLQSNVVCILDPASSADKVDILRVNRTREKQYAFDYVFEPGSTQDAVFHHTTKFLIHGVLDGYNATVFAYGQTGSGKTYTMIGTNDDPGIMVRVMGDLFKHSEIEGKNQGFSYKVTVSFLEVYNENIRDLLSDVEEYLDLREDPMKGPTVAGITEVEVSGGKDIMDLLTQGNLRRSQQPTAANEVSSRSHAVLQVVVEGKDKSSGTVQNIKVGKLSLVDLAGSERAANTQNRGARLVEGANINRSLLALGNCINALGEKGNKGNFVPYRDSKLTRLLKDSLGGNCRTVMIANISAAESSFEETLNTLKYANRAKNIKTNVQRNVLNVNHHISEYVHLIDNLRGEIKALKDQIGSNAPDGRMNSGNATRFSQNGLASPVIPGRGPAPTTPLQVLRESMKSAASLSERQGEGRELVNQMRKAIVENFQERMQLRRSLIELEDQNVQNSIEVSKRQLIVVKWSENRGMTPGKSHNENMEDFSTELLANASPETREAWLECEQLRKAIVKNNSMKKSIAKRLRQNEREADNNRKELNDRITGEDRRELMELQYQVGRLELENMELEQHRIVHESIVKGKDLTIQKLLLQLAVKDKIIQRQSNILKENNLESKVEYAQLALMERTLMNDNDEMHQSLAAPASPPRAMADMSVNSITQDSKQSKSSGVFVPMLNVSNVTNENSIEYDDSYDPPLTDIREIVLSSRDRGAFEAGDWSEIRSELSDSPTRSPFESRKGKERAERRKKEEDDMLKKRSDDVIIEDGPGGLGNVGSQGSFSSQEPSRGFRGQGGGVRVHRQYVTADGMGSSSALSGSNNNAPLDVVGKGGKVKGINLNRNNKKMQKEKDLNDNNIHVHQMEIEDDGFDIEPPVSGRKLMPLNAQVQYEEKEGERKDELSRVSNKFKQKNQFDSRFDRRNSSDTNPSNPKPSPRGKGNGGGMLHVPSLNGIGALSNKSGNDEGSMLPHSGRLKNNDGALNLSVAGKNQQSGASRRSEQNGKAKQLLKEVEDLYQGFQQNRFKGENRIKGQNDPFRGRDKFAEVDSSEIVMKGRKENIIGNSNSSSSSNVNNIPVTSYDGYVDDEFGDESVDTIMSDNSDNSQLTPRGDRTFQRRQNGPRGYGQGKMGVAGKQKPTKFKIQGAHKPIKIAVKERQNEMLNRNPSENIGTLVAQSYGGGANANSNDGGVGSNNAPLLLPVDNLKNAGRNRSLPTLQHRHPPN